MASAARTRARSPAKPAPVTLDALAARLAATMRRLREERGLTQQEAADACRLSLRGYQRLEAGKVDTRLDTLCAVAAGLGCAPSDLLAVQH